MIMLKEMLESKKKKKGRPMPYSIGEVSKKLREKLRRPKRLK